MPRGYRNDGTPLGGHVPGRKPSTGRPDKGPRRQITIRLPAAAAAELKALAEESHKSVSDIVALALTAWADYDRWAVSAGPEAVLAAKVEAKAVRAALADIIR